MQTIVQIRKNALQFKIIKDKALDGFQLNWFFTLDKNHKATYDWIFWMKNMIVQCHIIGRDQLVVQLLKEESPYSYILWYFLPTTAF